MPTPVNKESLKKILDMAFEHFSKELDKNTPVYCDLSRGTRQIMPQEGDELEQYEMDGSLILVIRTPARV